MDPIEASAEETSLLVAPPESESESKGQAVTYCDRQEKGNSLLFINLVNALSKVESIKGLKNSLDIIFTDRFFKYFEDNSLWPVLRLLLPGLDSRWYGIGESRMAGIICEAQGWSAGNIKRARLLNWTDIASYGNYHVSGDISNVVLSLIEDTINDSRELNVGSVNKLLDDLAACDKRSKQANVMRQIMVNMSSLEIKYVIRIILKDLKLGFGYRRVLNRIHPDAVLHYESHTDLRLLCYEVQNRSVRLAPEVGFGQTVSPMLAKRVDKDLEKLAAELKIDDFAIEPKIDGERALVHWSCSDSMVKIFSRNGVDLGKSFKYDVSLAIFFKDCIKNCRRVILDGELLSYDDSTKEFTKFGENRTVATEAAERLSLGEKVDAAGSRWLCYFVFDIIYVDGFDFSGFDVTNPKKNSLTCLSYRDRRRIMDKILQPCHSHIHIMRSDIIFSTSLEVQSIADSLLKYLIAAIDKGDEGIMIKKRSSPYVLNGRMEGHWIKVKPEYCDSMSDTLDLIILGGYFTKRSGGVSSFLLGVLQDHPMNRETAKFYTVGKVSGGFSRYDLEKLRSKLSPNEYAWPSYVSDSPSHFANGWKPNKTSDVPDRWYPPEKSIILSIKCMELIKSTNWSAGISFRFPRCARVRDDKEWSQCMIFSELSAMFHAKGSKASDRYSRGRLGVWKIRKRRGTPIQNEKASIRSIPNYFVKQNCIDHPITHEGQIFKNKKVYVVPFELPESQTLEFMLSINGKFDEGVSIRRHGDLEAVLSTNGASCFACNPKGGVDLLIGPPTQLISDSKVFQRIQDGSDTDIVRIEYIFRCLKEGAVCKPTGAEYLHVSKAARAYGFDKYGDHLQDFASKASLESLLLAKIRHNKKSKTDLSLTHMEQHNVSVDEARRILAKEELDPLFTVYTPFRDAVLYVDKYAATRIDSGDSEALDDRYRYSVLEASELLALLHDAKISPCFDSHVTHVITSLSPTSERYSSLMKQRATIMGTRGEHRLPRFVGPNWIVSVATSGRPWQECDESLVSSE